MARHSLVYLIRRPVLLWEAMRASLAMRRRGGLMPSEAYLAWRIYTAYGKDIPSARPADLFHYLRWRRRMRRLRGRGVLE